MSSIDKRVVQMNFDNNQFQQGIKQTLTSLDQLDKSLKLEGATKGLENVASAAGKFTLDHISNAVDSLVNKFRTLSIVAITAITNIVNRAVDAGFQLAKSLSTEPIIAGLHEYETNLNSIQTILANTGLEGQAGLDKVNAALKQLNDYSDQTIYNFSEMARNIGTFTAAGVTLDVATKAIKGIANLAAISGSNAEQASAAMYQLSQAISAGKVSLEDWNSVVNAGLGGKVFQNALIETARVHGVAIDRMIKEEGSFRLTLQKGWLTSNILTETLQKFTGDLTAQQLKAMGYNKQQIEGILKMGKTAQEAATKVKTFSQLLSTLQEAAGSGWTQTWQLIFGDFEEARSLFTNVNNVLSGFINASSDARNKVLGDWKELGGRTVLIQAISNAFQALIAVLRPIRDAFRQIFPATTGKQLYDLTVTIRNFTQGLKIGGETANNLRRTFAGVFAVLDIGWDILKGVVKLLFSLVGIGGKGAGSLLEITAKIGDFLVRMHDAVENGQLLLKFFDKVGEYASKPIKFLNLLASRIASMFDGVDTGGGSKFLKLLKDIWEWIKPLAEKVGQFFSKVGKAVKDALQNLSFKDVLKVIDTGLFAGVVAALFLLVSKIKGLFGGAGGGIIDTIKESFDQLTDTLKSMQNTLRAATLIEIAIAVGLLTISLIALSRIDPDKLVVALSAIAVMFTELIVAMKQLEEVVNDKETAKLIGIGAALILFAIAVDILTSSVKKLAELDWNGAAKGLTGLLVILASLVATVKFMPDDKKLFSTGVALLVLAASIKVLVSSVTELAGMSWQDLAKGLTGVAALLGALFLFTKFAKVDKGGIKSGAGIILLATGIKILSDALLDISKLSWQEIAKGLTGIAGGLALVVGSMELLPNTAILGGAGILVVSLGLASIAGALKQAGDMNWEQILKGLVALDVALELITGSLLLVPPTAIVSAAAILVTVLALKEVADVLKQLGDMSWGSIAKSLVELAGTLAIISAALYLMEGALGGAAALIVVAGALAILAPILERFGNMSWGEIGKGLFALAGIFVVLGAAGVGLAIVLPLLIGLGVAITLIGIGFLAAGAGVLLFATGLSTLSVVGAAATVVLVGMLTALIALLPTIGTKLAQAVVSFANVISTSGPQIVAAFVTLLNSFLDAAVVMAPKIVNTLLKILSDFQDAALKYIPKFTDTGLKILVGFLDGVARNTDKVVTSATNVVVNFINAAAKNQPRIIQAGINFIIDFINGLAKGIRDNSDRMSDAGLNLASAIIEGMVKGLSKGAGKVADKAKDVAKGALDSALHFLGVNSPSKEFMKVGEYSDQGFALGLTKFAPMVARSAEDVAKTALESLGGSMSDMSDILTSGMDLQPIITPVLDFTDLNKNVGQIDKILAGTRTIDLSAMQSSASNASNGFEDNRDQAQEAAQAGSGPTTNYTQNNYSPKALDSATIYRQTKNQLAVTKGGLPD